MKSSRRKQRSIGAAWPVAYRWIAMGTFVVYTAVGSKTINTAYAQEARNAVPVRDSAGPSTPLVVRRFEISAGSLGSVLDAFQAAAGVHISMKQQGIRVLSSPGVSGLYTVDQALHMLLKDTGVSYRFTDNQNVMLDLAGIATTVEVTAAGTADLATSTPKYAGPLRDTPQTISVVPRQVLDQQGNTTLRDALRNVAGISLAAGEGGAQGDNLTIRGFTARNDLFIDGMRDFGSYYRDPFNLDEVEVLQGPSSVTFGRGSTGGVVNQSTKTPNVNRFLAGEADFGTDLTRRVVLDFNTPLRKLGEGTAFRLNVMGNEGNVAGRDVAENRRFGIAPSLVFGLGSDTRWTLSYFHQTGDDNPDYGIPWLMNGPAPVDRHNYYGFQDGNFLRTYDDIGTVRGEHDFNSHFSLRTQTRYANYVRDVLITEPRLAGTITPATPLSSIVVNRGQIGVNSQETYLDEQLDLTARFQTGFIRHRLVTGAEVGRETSDPTRPTYTNVATASLLNPDPNQPFTGSATITSRVSTTSRTAAVYALETMQLGRRWELTGGLRWDRFGTDYQQFVAPISAFSRVDRMPTWRTAATFKPVSIGSIYFAAGTSFNPSAESLSLSAATANLPPEKNRTYEAGTKWDVSGGRLSLRGAWFQTEKMNAREPDPNNSLLNVLAGNQMVKGVQAEMQGRLTSRWTVLTSYAFLNARVISSSYYPASVGARLANVPEDTFNIWTSYRLPGQWDVGAGSNFVSSRTASSTAPLDPATGLVKQVPGYWVFNAMASHPVNEHISLQVNVYNLANRYYYDQLHPGHIVLGPGRSALAGIKFKF